MPDQTTTPLDTALAEVIAFARAHGVDAVRLTPADFGHQLTEGGHTHTTYVDGDHVISAHIDRHGHTRVAVGVVEWIHDESDEDSLECDYCDLTDALPALPMVDVYLPGDAPAATEEVGANA